MKEKSPSSHAILILIMAIITGFTLNAFSSKGVPLYTDYAERKKLDNTDSSLAVYKNANEFKNNPYDTTAKPKPTSNNPNLTPEGFIRPQKINFDLAKVLYEKNALMIDARLPEQYNAGHVKDALNIPYEEFAKLKEDEKKEKMRKYNKDGIVIVYCNGGECDMSIDLAYEFAKIGFNATNIYLGGYKEWEAKGMPVQK